MNSATYLGLTFTDACKLSDYYNRTGDTGEFTEKQFDSIMKRFNLSTIEIEVDPAGGFGLASHI